MRLSEHFTLEEFCTSQIAERQGIPNKPSAAVIKALQFTASQMEIVRNVLKDKPIFVSSGYRSPELNAIVGGVLNSDHTMGWAVDFVCPGFGTPKQICTELSQSILGFTYDQLIWEWSWVHIAFGPARRREVLSRNDRGFSIGLVG